MENGLVLQLQVLKKYFGSTRAVDGITLSVARSQLFGFLGPNGSGKTTTISLILGLLHPTSGSIRLFGEPVTPIHARPLRRVGALVGTPALLPYLSARDNLELLLRLNPETSSTRIDHVLELVGLAKDAKRKTGQYSTGMKQRLGIAMSLLHEPELLILDEPTNGLDPAGMVEIRNLLSSLSHQGVTIFLSSHLLHEVEQICDRVAVLKQGNVIVEGQVADLLQDTQTVRLKVKMPNQAISLLRRLPDHLEIRSNATSITVSGLPGERVIGYLVSNGIIPLEVKTGQLDLEQFYLQHTNAESMEVNHVLEPFVD